MRIPSGSTDRKIGFVAVDSTDLKTRETGLTTFTVYRSRNGGVATAMTTPTVAELDATNMPGVYTLLLDEDTTLTAGNDSEEMILHISQASMAPVTRTVEIYRPETTEGNTLDVTSTGAAGIDFGNVENQSTSVTLSGTTVGTVTTNTDMRGTDNAALAATALSTVTWTAARAGYLDNINGHTAQTGDSYARLDNIEGATFNTATDSLEAIRDRGDAAWTTGAGGSDRLLMVDTTIATLASQTSFTLTAGSTDDNAYNNCTIVVEDSATSTQKAVGLVSAYTGATKTVTLKYDPAVFTMAATDKVYILAENALKATDANRQLDVTATGAAGIDWGNVENQSTAVDLSATDIQLCDTITTYTGNTVQTGDNYARLGAPAGASVSADVAAVKVDTAAILVDTSTTLDAHLTDIKGTGFVKDTHSLVNIEGYVDLIDDGTSGLAKIATDVAAVLVDTGTDGVVVAAASKTGYALSATGTDLVLVDGKTLPASIQIIAAACAGKVSGAGSGTEVFKGLDGTTTRATVTVDASGNRTGVTY